MPYEGEYAHYQPLKRIVESERVQQLLRRSRVLDQVNLPQQAVPKTPPVADATLPSLVLAIDGSHAEVDVRNGYPGAKIGYCSVASVVLNLSEVDRLDASRPVSPIDFRRTEAPSSDASALPGCNVITRDHTSAKDSFREAAFELLHDAIIDEEDNTRLLATYQALLAYKPTSAIACPYTHLGCERDVTITPNVETCSCELRKPLYYAMFPTGFATTAVKAHTEPGDYVFDPFAGRGTSLFAAASENRIGLGIEINPVGWVYGKAKLQTAEKEDVERRIRWLGVKAENYKIEAKSLPQFFHSCFSLEVRRFLLAARDLLDWRRRKTDWTAMALLMIDLHGKRESALSNQMRQTKAMSPQYAIDWWKERELTPPERDPVEFMLKKVEWRYAKGRLDSGSGHIYFGDCKSILNQWQSQPSKFHVKLLLTSPPYYGVTNYFYDQWLRLWLLGGPPKPQSPGDACKRKFENKRHYVEMLRHVFAKSKPLLSRNAVVYVRTDAREFTREATIKALESAFPRKKLQSQNHSLPNFSQTSLFDSEIKSEGEVDFVMW